MKIPRNRTQVFGVDIFFSILKIFFFQDIHQLTSKYGSTMRVVLSTHDSIQKSAMAEYNNFKVLDESRFYKLAHIGEFCEKTNDTSLNIGNGAD